MCGTCPPARSVPHDASSGLMGRKRGVWSVCAAVDRGVRRTSRYQDCTSNTTNTFTQSAYVSHEVHFRSFKCPLLLKAG